MKRILVLALGLILACQKGGGDARTVRFGATAGPYVDMVRTAIAPALQKQGYSVVVTEFTDYVQPNLALANGDLDANLFQHTRYLERFSQDRGLDLTPLIPVPTAPNGIYSKKVRVLGDLRHGAVVAIANDPTNLSRHLGILQKAGLLRLKGEVDLLKASEKDIDSTVNGLTVRPIDAAQLPRSLDEVDVAIVTGNFALASGLKLTEAIVLEDLPAHFVNVVAVRSGDRDSAKATAIKEAVESAEYAAVIRERFAGFQRPEWFKRRHGDR